MNGGVWLGGVISRQSCTTLALSLLTADTPSQFMSIGVSCHTTESTVLLLETMHDSKQFIGSLAAGKGQHPLADHPVARAREPRCGCGSRRQKAQQGWLTGAPAAESQWYVP
jgi:hypothetical protein